MKKFTAFVFALLTLLPFVVIAWLLYSNFASTPVAIINLLIIMTGVMLAFIVYNRIIIGKDENSIKANTEHYPHIESALIYVLPSDFVSKLEKTKGKIFMVSTDEIEKDITLINGEYNKLTDVISLTYSNGISTTIKGATTIAVGDNQFLFYGFEELIHTKGKEKSDFIWEQDRLVQKKGEELVSIRIPDRLPVYIFDWK
jgi:hypothetical protein